MQFEMDIGVRANSPNRHHVTVHYDRFSFKEDQASQLAFDLINLGFKAETKLEMRGGGSGLIQEMLQLIFDSTWKAFAAFAVEETFRHIIFKALRKPDRALLRIETSNDHRTTVIQIPSTEPELARAFDLLNQLSGITSHHMALTDESKKRVTLSYSSGQWSIFDADTGEEWKYESDSLVLQPRKSSSGQTL